MAETAVTSCPLDSHAVPGMGRREVWAIVLIVGSTLPLFVVHLRNLWLRPHYQFCPLLLVGIGWLVWQRWPRTGLARDGLRLEAKFLLWGLTVLAANVLLFSPWLAAVATLLTTGGLVLGLRGRQTRREWLPVWALLWLLVPPPMAWDLHAIKRLQLVASRAASLMLDVCGVGHLMEGNVLVLPGHRLLVEEACSGINSLVTLLAITALFVVATRRPFIWSGLLLVSSACWAGLMNAARVAIVAMVQAGYGLDWSSGWPHTTLGFTTLILALLMTVCTDRLLAFLLGPIEPADPEHELNPLSRAWNWCVGECGTRNLARVHREDEDDVAAGEGKRPLTPDPSPRSTGARGKVPVPRSTGLRGEVPVPRSTGLRGEMPVPRSTGASGEVSGRVPRWIVATFVTCAALQLLGLTAAAARRKGHWTEAQRLTRPDLFRRADLPATVDDWRQVNFTTEEHEGDFGDFRMVWTYRSEQRECLVSVGYPFRGWHDVRDCYFMKGWRIVDSAELRPAATTADPAPYLEARMIAPGGEQGFLLFSLVDQAGRAVEIPGHASWRRLADRVAGNPLWSSLPKDSLDGQEATFQLQTLVASRDDLPAAEQQAVHRLFVAARQTLLAVYNRQQHQVGDE